MCINTHTHTYINTHRHTLLTLLLHTAYPALAHIIESTFELTSHLTLSYHPHSECEPLLSPFTDSMMDFSASAFPLQFVSRSGTLEI